MLGLWILYGAAVGLAPAGEGHAVCVTHCRICSGCKPSRKGEPMRAYLALWVMLCLGWLYGMSTLGTVFHFTIGATVVLDIVGLIYTSTAMIIGGWPKGEG